MSLETKLGLLAGAIGADVKLLVTAQGNLASLPTTAKTNLVAAIAELHGLIAGAGADVVIDDAAGAGDLDVVYSADKVVSEIASGVAALRDELTGGASAALDTFAELAAALGQDANMAATLTAALGNRVRFDAAQALTAPQQTQARSNIGALGAADLTSLETSVADLVTGVGDLETGLTDLTAAVGDVEADLVALYNAAKA